MVLLLCSSLFAKCYARQDFWIRFFNLLLRNFKFSFKLGPALKPSGIKRKKKWQRGLKRIRQKPKKRLGTEAGGQSDYGARVKD